MPVLRRFIPGGATWTDADILDPTADVPGYMRKFRATASEVVIDVYGKTGTDAGDLEESVGAMTIDAYVGWESPSSVAPESNPPATERPSIRRGQTLIESTGVVAPGVTRIVAEGEPGAIGILRLDLLAIGSTALEVTIIRGGRPL